MFYNNRSVPCAELTSLRMIDTLRARNAQRRAGVLPPVGAIRETSEFHRVLNLPRRQPRSNLTEMTDLVTEYTTRLRTPQGTMALRDVQAIALAEAESSGGLFANIGVGRGKTLLSLLLPVVLNSVCSVLLIPAALREQLLQRNVPELSKHWRIPSVGAFRGSRALITVLTHSELSAKSTASALEAIQPDLIVIDEADALMGDSARSDRLFYAKGQRPNTRVIAMSGTLIDEELIRASKAGSITLGLGSPYPRDHETIKDWADILDIDGPRSAGALAKFAGPGESIRAGFRRRVLETPGVIAAAGIEDIGVSLTIKARPLKVPQVVREDLATLRSEWTTPSGEELTESVDFVRHAIELSQGFCYYWDWPIEPDEEWLTARRDWNRAARKKLAKKPGPGMDSPGLLADAAAAGTWNCPAWAPWAAVKARKQPPTVAAWISHFLVEDAVMWGKEAPGIVWYEHAASLIGAEIANRGGFQLFDGNGPDPIEAGVTGERTIVLSRRAYGVGIDGLQHKFDRMLVTCPLSNPRGWEQLLGRVHRHGQKRPVTCDVYVHTRELKAAFEDARDKAQKVQDLGAEPQKLLYADVIV